MSGEFTQDFFTSRRNFDDGNTRIGELDRLWYDSNTNTIRIGDGITPGGIVVSGGGGGPGTSGYSGWSGRSGVSGWSGARGTSGYSGVGYSGASGISGYSGVGISGFSGWSGQAGGGVNPWIKKTSFYVASNGDRIIADTSAGSFVIDLPAAPILGYYVVITDGADFATNNLIVGRNGSTVEGLPDDVALDMKGVTFEFIYSGSTWQVTATTGASGTSGYSGVDGVSGYSGALDPWKLITTTYYAQNGNRLIGDTGAGSFTVYLPAAAVNGDYVQITDGDNFAINNLFVDPNGGTVEGLSDIVALDMKGVTYEFIYSVSTWDVTATTGASGSSGSSGFSGLGVSGYSGASGFSGNNILALTTTVDLNNSSSTVNTSGKSAGLMVFNTTNNLIYVAVGSGLTDQWYPSDGGAAILPI